MSPTSSVSGFRYYVLFTDEYSRFTWVYPMRRKNEVFTHFQSLVVMIQNHFHSSIKFLQSDNGTEYVTNAFSHYCKSLGILQRFSCPHTPQQNGLAERKHQHIATMTRTLLLTSGVPHNLWVEAVLTSVYLINLLPTPVFDWATPYSCLYGRSPPYSSLRVFGCSCFPYLGPYVSDKLSSRSIECVFLGYSPNHKGYRCLNPKTGRVYVSRNVLFNENSFPFKDLQVPSNVPPGPLHLFTLSSPLTFPPETVPTSISPPASDPPTTLQLLNSSIPSAQASPCNSDFPLSIPAGDSTVTPPPSPPSARTPLLQYTRRRPTTAPATAPLSPPSPATASRNAAVPPISPPPASASPDAASHPSSSSLPAAPSSPLSNSPAPSPDPPVNAPPPAPAPSHPMVTRLRDGIVQTRALTDGTASQKPEWRAAMTEEINALLKNNTWTLVPPSSSQNTVGCKWVFRVKRKSDGSIERYKARLVAKGFHQQQGIDYGETYSPVIKPATIRTVLSIAVSRGWSLRQLDVKNAFLHGVLTEDVYMVQPPGFVDQSRPSHVCKLNKALYGLKQAPRAWFQRMSTFLLSVGFSQSLADSSLFIYRHGQHQIFFLLYVDDIVVTGSNVQLLQSFIDNLGRGFDIKDLGPLHYFLGLQVTKHYHGLHINQLKYAHDLLSKHDLLLSKPVSTPMSAKSDLHSTDGVFLENPTLYRELVGSLQYLTITRPDIAFAVNLVSQFMSQPRVSHLIAVKRILRYVKGSLGHGLLFTPQRQPVHLSAYSDADWAGCPTSRRSTSGYLVYLGSNLISWCSKKQPTVARSSAESEYRALAHASAETTWLGYLLYELGATIHFPILLHCDNLSTTYMASNPVFHARTKHIELDYHYVREKVARGSHRVCFIPSRDQPADLLTKPLHKSRHLLFTSKLVRPGRSSLRGDVKDTQSSSITSH
ncbi:putative RNA-directed DNA polymerase [Rosa chinensis]|uniref:Putative RNA-directed DNA polymerase n=1 Tax=Rosa chinensis TaxID=74649 RepID=A0A2P6P2Y0_ROSCH|nr:putative RNA-directed DNA polymerase [Rosa chinensis]